MSSGAKQLVQIAKETVIGTVPSPFARQTLAFTDISLNQSVEKTESASITDNRLQQSSMITSAEYSGELSAEAQYGAYDDLMAAAAFNAWATNVLALAAPLVKHSAYCMVIPTLRTITHSQACM